MKKILLSLCASVALTAPALAADLPVVQEAPAATVSAAPQFDFGGFYAGVHTGFGGGTPEGSYDYNGTTYTGDFDEVWGLLGGLHAGYNHMLGQYFIGLEVQADVLDWEHQNGTGHVYAQWSSDAKLRAGMTFDRYAVYAAAGFGAMGVKLDSHSDWGSSTETHATWNLGGGAAAFLTDKISLDLNYQYTGLFSADHEIAGEEMEIDGGLHAGRVGISYHF
ncbi:outer membrane protein [Roseibium sp. RKSG952]|uniref:outer membrane protein n=1 Tax=Roseibium sp. RKSG952 TaxID=2529384 RepID=UPI0018AD22F6|nr:outer membrane beta-barrel protein [Roseibium sp. RKSG952]